MPTAIPREYLDALTQGMDTAIDAGRQSTRALLEELVANSDGKGPLDIVEQVAEAIEPVLQSTVDQTAALSAQSYDMLRTAVTGEAFGAVPYTERDKRWTKRALWGIAGDHRDNMDAFIQGVLDRVDYEAKRAAGKTTFQNGKLDPKRPRYARVPTGTETCRFCVMLASRGFVYHSEQTAGALDHYHPNCKCRIVAGYDGMVIDGYDPDEYLDLWEQMENEGIDKLHNGVPERDTVGDSIDREASVYSKVKPEYQDVIERSVSTAPESARRLYQRFEHDFKLSTIGNGGAYFHPRDCTVRLNPDLVFGPGHESERQEGETWFHEFGHSIDWMATGTDNSIDKFRRLHDLDIGNYHASVRYKDGLFGRTIRSEVDAKVKDVWNRRKKAFNELAKAHDYNGMAEAGLIRQEEADFLYRLKENFDGMGERRGQDPDKLMRDSMAFKDAKRAATSKASAYREISDEITALDHRHNGAISDLFAGVTKCAVRDFWLHGKSYWKDQNKVPIEGFAEFYSAVMNDPEAVDLINEWLPESKKVFDELLEAMGRDDI